MVFCCMLDLVIDLPNTSLEAQRQAFTQPMVK